MQSLVCGFYLIVLRFLWFCHGVFLPKNSEDNKIGKKIYEQKFIRTKRHIIRLTCMKSPNGPGNQSTYEIMSPDDEEILRKTCAKGCSASTSEYSKYNKKYYRQKMTKQQFNALWKI